MYSPGEQPQSAVQVATIVVLNIIYWMVMLTAMGLGAIYLGQCPLQPYIPVYLLVSGASSVVVLSLTYLQPACGKGTAGLLAGCCGAFLYMFIFAWFITGTYWIYVAYPPNSSPGSDRYCHQTVYQFSFIVTTLQWVVIGLALIYATCFALVTCCIAFSTRRRLIPTRSSFYGAIRSSQEPIAGDMS